MRKTHGTVNSTGVGEEAAFELGVVYSAVKDELVAFAAKEGNPYSFADVAARVSKLLQAEALREQLRDSEYLSQMRQNGSSDHRGRPPKSGRYELAAEAAVFAGSSGGRTLSKKARRAISKAQRVRWAAYHARKDADRARWRKSKQGRRRAADPNLTAAGKPRKRILTPAQLEAMRENAVKARAANRKKKHPPMSAEQRAKISASMKAAFASRKAAGAA